MIAYTLQKHNPLAFFSNLDSQARRSKLMFEFNFAKTEIFQTFFF